VSARVITRLITFALGGLVLACGDAEEPSGEDGCPASIWAAPRRGGVVPSVLGQWSQWSMATPMSRFDATWWLAEPTLPPGEYGYLIVEEGEAALDPHNGLGGFRASDGVEVSWLVVDDCTSPRVGAELDDDGALRLRPIAAQGAAPPETIELRRGDDVLAEVSVADDDGAAALPQLDLPRGRHALEARTRDREGVVGPDTPFAVFSDPIAPERADDVIYHVMIDRFRGDEGAVLAPPPSPGVRAGGTLSGVRAELERGALEAVGASTLWLSPVYLNPDELRVGREDDHLYEGYHGYWPVDTRAVDPRIGGEAELDALVAAAHDRGIRVVLDLVPNHYDITNARVDATAEEGWFNVRDPVCVCGMPDCPWSTEIQRCWFTPYLPDLRLEHPDALLAAIDDALWWQGRFGIDGFRVDAVPMMPRAATRRIYRAVRDAVGPASGSLLLGEVFTGPGEAGIAALRYHLGPDGLDSTFDFPTMWAIRDVLTGRVGFDALVRVLEAEDDALAGSGAVLARMLGNHDTARIASVVAGDDGRDPWDDPPPAVVDAEVLARVRLGFALVLTLPGIPVLYYGDEFGVPGAADPDNRRVMPDPAALDASALALFGDVARLGQLRRCMKTMRRGGWRRVGASADHFAFVRELPGDAPALVVLSASSDATSLTIPATVAAGWYTDVMSGERLEIGATGATIELPPWGVRVLVSEEHACA